MSVSPVIKSTRIRGDRTTRRFRHVVVVVVTPLVALLGVWWAFLALIHTSPLIAKTPVDVFREFVIDPGAVPVRQALWDGFVTTLAHGCLGLVAGMIVAVTLAAVVSVSKFAAIVVRPIALALTCVPTVAFAPILILIFKNGFVVVAVIGGLITMVPSLYYLLQGLRSVDPTLIDAIRAGGGGKKEILFYAQMPTAVPSIALSLRIAAPGALVGALLSEWLATGNGLGQLMIVAQSTFDYGSLWAATFVVTLTGMILYGFAVVLEARLLDRWSPGRDRSVGMS